MSNTNDFDQAVARIARTADLDESVVRDKLRTLTDEYKLPLASAIASVRNDLDVAEPSSADRDGESELTTIPALEGEQWGALKIRVRELWDSPTPNISQVCLVEDEPGNTAKLSVFDSDFTDDAEPQFESDAVYLLRDAVGDFYEGNAGIRIPNTTVERLDPSEFDSGVTFTGVVVGLQNGSGLIKRCSHDDCTRVLTNSRCPDHGPVSGTFDTRLKLVVSTGAQDVTAIISDDERIEALTGLSLDDATDIAQDTLDTSAVTRQMGDAVRGSILTVTGTVISQSVLVDDLARGRDDVTVADFNATVPIQADGYTRHPSIPSLPSELVHISDVGPASDEDQAPIMATLPDGTQANRILTVGATTTITNFSDSDADPYLQVPVTDRHGNTVNVYAGQYQPDARDQVEMLSTPAHVLVVGKPATWTDDEGTLHFKLTAETVVPISKQTRQLLEAVAARNGVRRLDADQEADSFTDDQRADIADALTTIQADNPVVDADGASAPADD